MQRSIWTLLTALLVGLAVVAAACGSDDPESEDSSAESTPGPADAEATGEPTEDATEEPSDEPADAPTDDATTEPTDEPVELTATWTGVTEDTIRVGVAEIDAEAVLEFGVELDILDPDKVYPAYAAAFNEAGGAHGRQVDVTVELFLPVGNAESDAACTLLTQDVEVFLALGRMLNDNPLCFTELHDTPYVGAFGLTDERDERSNGQFWSFGMANERQRSDSVIALDEAGVFDGARVGLYWSQAELPVVDDVIRPLLEDLGVDVVSEAQLDDYAGDTAATEAALEIIFERFAADGADTLLNVSEIVSFSRGVEQSGYEGQLVYLNGQMTNESLVADSDFDPDILIGAVGAAGAGATFEEKLSDELWLDCVEVLNTYGGFDEPLVPEELEDAIADYIRGTCATWRLMEAMLVAAGPELTPESLSEGAEGLGEIQLPATFAASLAPGKHDASDAVRLFEYDPDAVVFVPASDPFVAGS